MPTPIACDQVLQFRRLPPTPLQLHDGRLPELSRTNGEFPALAALKRLEVRKSQFTPLTASTSKFHKAVSCRSAPYTKYIQLKAYVCLALL